LDLVPLIFLRPFDHRDYLPSSSAKPRAAPFSTRRLGNSCCATSATKNALSVASEDARVRLVRLAERGHAGVLASRRIREKLEQRLLAKLGEKRAGAYPAVTRALERRFSLSRGVCQSGRMRSWAWLLIAACACAPGQRSVLAGRASAGSDSVCAFTGETRLGAPASDGTVAVSARHPLLSYGGRVDCEAAGGPSWGFVGASVRVRFRGRSLAVRLQDHGGGTAQTTNYYDVSVDGGAPRLLEVSPARQEYDLAVELPQGEHEVELFKRVELAPGGNPGAGKAQLLGFLLRGTELLPVRLPPRRLEFVGDSITCGYGNELATAHPEAAHYTTRNSNGHAAYGALAARELGAQYLAVAYSGRGISRNFAGSAGQLLPEMYLSSVPEEPAASVWRPLQYVPDAVIVNLGTNDFSTPGVDRQAFVQKYTQFLTSLRGYYPRAALVAALGPMLNDFYPPGAQAWTRAQVDVKAVVAMRQAAGDSNVHLVTFEPQSEPWGEDFHPTLATHQKMAAELSAALRKILGWGG
jgi:lysophospholipase L1-like esterase